MSIYITVWIFEPTNIMHIYYFNKHTHVVRSH